MINAAHAIIYADDPAAARAFFRDVLGFANVDAHGGWLIFKLPPAELGMHPTRPADNPDAQAWAPSGHHELYLMCDDIEATVQELKGKGADFSGGVEEAGFGLLVHIKVPGAGQIGLYQPRHPTAYHLEG
ncbi:MAG TPA: VOC family protein [Acidimicrobiales bacterium]|nr:VOC family protein [Acidimicrobiales bacterium]